MSIQNLVKAFVIKEKYKVSLITAKKIIYHTHFACDGDWSAEECWELRGYFIDREFPCDDLIARKGNAINARAILEKGFLFTKEDAVLTPDLYKIGRSSAERNNDETL